MRFTNGRILVLGVVMAAALLLFNATASAAKYEKLYEFLKDIKGWKAEKAQGMQMDMPEIKMIQATREYKKDKNELQAMIIVGNTSTMGAYVQQPSMKYEDDGTKVVMKEIDGFKTHVIFDKEDKSGTISVILDSNENGAAVFILSFEGINDEAALKIAMDFDWKGMKKKLKDLD